MKVTKEMMMEKIVEITMVLASMDSCLRGINPDALLKINEMAMAHGGNQIAADKAEMIAKFAREYQATFPAEIPEPNVFNQKGAQHAN